jgi:hypothetical protein
MEDNMSSEAKFSSFSEFYPFYLTEHQHPVSCRLHLVGTTVSLLLLVAAILLRSVWLLVLALAQGYALAWIGHFFFERNRPATFRHPLWSLAGDFRMWWESICGRPRY